MIVILIVFNFGHRSHKTIDRIFTARQMTDFDTVTEPIISSFLCRPIDRSVRVEFDFICLC